MSDDEESAKGDEEGEGYDRDAIAREIFVEDEDEEEGIEARERPEPSAPLDKEFADLDVSEGESGKDGYFHSSWLSVVF